MPLHDYQLAAVSHLHRHPRAGLFLDMGLGKTAVVLSALTPAHLPALVVAPKRVVELVWAQEGRKWRPDLRVGRALGTPAERSAVIRDRSFDVVVVTRDNLRDPAIATREWKTLVLDESSGFKKFGGVRWKAAKRIQAGPAVDYLWELTGTPSPNGLGDLFAPMYLLDMGHRLGRTQKAFRERWYKVGHRLPNGIVSRWDLLPGAEQEIRAAVSDVCMSMQTEGRIKLPPHTWNTVQVPLPPGIMDLHDTMRDDMVVKTRTRTYTAGTPGAVGNRLSQITAGFLYQDTEESEMLGTPRATEFLHTERPKAVREIIEGTDSPVLVFYRYQAELEMLREEFGKDLHTPKDANVFDRWNRTRVPILASHPASIGHGLNLQDGGHTAIWTTPIWDLELWDQANGRLPRQGQRHPVVTHMLSSPGTVDPQVYAGLRAKKNVQDILMDYLESPL